MDAQTLNFWLNNLAANEKDDVDSFGVVVLGSIAAAGGGTLRDLIIGVPVFWLLDAIDIRLTVLASACVFLARPTMIDSLESSFIYNFNSWPGSSVGRAKD